MERADLIPAEEFCSKYDVEFSFIHSLQEYGLIEMITMEEKGFIPVSQLTEVEKLSRLHYDLEINVAGIEAISHLLQRIREMQDHLNALKNRLMLYENL